MHHHRIALAFALAGTVLAVACNRDVREEPNTASEKAGISDRTADLQRERNDDIARLNDRVAALEKTYGEANAKVVSGDRVATAGLREELKEDIVNLRKAVDDLRTTTPDNWWDRHEQAMKQTADDVEADVSRLAGKIAVARPTEVSADSGEPVSTAPFNSRRDVFVAALGARAEAMSQALDRVKAKGAQETEVEDVRARVKKLDDDVDRLRSSSADDWWDVTKARVTEYVDRVGRSVDRLDDDRS